MDDLVRKIAVMKIAVIQGAPAASIQQLFATLADRWQPSLRLAGVVAEDHGLADRACSAGYLRSLRNGERFRIFQDLGPGSTGCHLAGEGALAATVAVQRDIANGCDLVVLNKFGKLEAGGGGLRDAFSEAIEWGIPVLTSVSPAFATAWQEFAGSLSVVLPADGDRIEAWQQAAVSKPSSYDQTPHLGSLR
jgi:hypothetical protein